MRVSEPGTVVRVPFPYSDGQASQHRPALTIAAPAGGFLLWVLMITSRDNRPWEGDVPIPDHAAAGLPAPSVIRTAKVATIAAARAEARGMLDADTLGRVRAERAATLELSAP